ncbi:MAG: PAS domain S-box protein [Undibacterium sp.]|uniref:PAS domain S-box protein n=1 Tax=Undibacterium sp. TaxID=1914977 RepID=UPI0027201AB1|nr:PAS domain S-box protein [Undibacterium sp.]MDO8652227.1 PAS domain S-box protein [Undibacterium sp.]
MLSQMIQRFTNWISLTRLSTPFSFKNKLVVVVVFLFFSFILGMVFFSASLLKIQFSQILAHQQFASTERLAAEIESALRERTQILSIGAENFPADLSLTTLEAYLSERKVLYPLFSAGIAVIGLDGKIIADYPVVPGRRDIFVGDRDYFRHVLTTRKLFIGKPIISRSANRTVLPIAVPIFDAGGNVRAVLAGFVDLKTANFITALSNSAITEKGEFFIVSPRDNVLVATTNPAQVHAAPPVRGVSTIYDQFLDGFEGSGVANSSKGIPKLYSGKFVPISGWIVIAALPTSVVFEPINRMQNYLFFLAVIMALMAIFIIQWMVTQMLTSVDDARKAMREMTEGKTPLGPLPIGRYDEIGKLIGNFNQLTEERRRYESALAASEQRFRTLVESAPDAIFVQANARFAYVNPAAVRLFGADTKDLLLGQTIVSRIHPDFREAAEERFRITNDAKRNNPPQENQFLLMDGTPVYVESSSVPFHFENMFGSLIFARDVTERKHADQVLRESETRYRSLFDNMLEGYALCQMIFDNGQAQDFIYLDVNPAFERLSGLKNVVGKKVSEIIPNLRQTNSELFDIYSRVALGGATERFESYIAALDKWYSISAYSARKGYFVAVFDDITDKLNTERLQRKQAEEVRSLVENSPDMIFRLDRNFRCVYVNFAIETVTGLQRTDILSRSFEMMEIAAETTAKLKTSITKVFITGEADTFDFLLQKPNGEQYYQVRMTPEFGPDGAVQFILGVARDVSDIKDGEAVLRKSEQRIHGITANTPGMVFQCLQRAKSDELLFIYVSEGSMLLLGLTPAQIQANQNAITDHLVEWDRVSFHDSLRASSKSMGVWNWEGRVALTDGEEKWINCRATPRLSDDGDIIWEGVMFNISEGKRHEQELKQSRKVLRELSAHTEIVLEEERKRIAREVHDELGQALTVLRMDVSLLRLNFGGQSPQLMERILLMRDGVDRTIQMVRDITSALRPVALDLGLIAGLEWLVQEFIKHSGIDCQLQTNGCEEVTLDDSLATALFRIVQESLTNVTKHAEASEVVVLIELESDESIRLEISDNGKGFIADGIRKSGSFGLIGMRERALMLHGAIHIHSVPGQGTHIKVCIPLGLQSNVITIEPNLGGDDD